MTDEVIVNAEAAVATAATTEAAKVEAPVESVAAKVEAPVKAAVADVKAAVTDTKSFVEHAKEALENDGHAVSQFILHVEARLKALELAIEKRLGIKTNA